MKKNSKTLNDIENGKNRFTTEHKSRNPYFLSEVRIAHLFSMVLSRNTPSVIALCAISNEELRCFAWIKRIRFLQIWWLRFNWINIQKLCALVVFDFCMFDWVVNWYNKHKFILNEKLLKWINCLLESHCAWCVEWIALLAIMFSISISILFHSMPFMH